jgi:outer membrane protein assembly factor BamB
MKYLQSIVLLLLVVALTVTNATAQKCVNPNFEAHRLDFRDLGYPSATEIPADNTPIASLLAHSNGKVYGATSGKQSYLFVYDYLTNKVFPLGKIPGSSGVHNSLVEGADGQIYIGTGLNELALLNLSKEVPHGRRTIEIQLWNDIKARYNGFEGGRLFVYDPNTGDKQVYLPEDKAQVTDLGIAVPGNSIYALAISPDKKKIYGISYPDANFFEYDIQAKTHKNHGPWLTIKSYAGPERSWRSVPRALTCLPDGRVFSSGDNGLMYYFDPNDKKIHETTMRIPGEYWITQKYEGFPVVEQLLQDGDGSLLGSASDGFIFRIDAAAQKLKSLGKPMVERRVRAMTIGKDRLLYMICGEKDNVNRLFAYDLSDNNGGFSDYGVLGVDRSPYYAKIGYQFDAMCTAADGTIFIGESDRRAKLFFYVPGGNIVPGGLNPTNPK